MSTASPRTSFHARFVFPVEGEPIPGGCVTVEAGRVVNVGPATDQAAAVDLGNVAILPGLVNAHTHLEFSDLAKPLGQPGMAFPDWIRLVIDQRGRGNPDPRQAIARGLAESLRRGTTTLGEISTFGWPPAQADQFPAAVTSFLEIRGLDSSKIDEILRNAAEHVECAVTDTNDNTSDDATQADTQARHSCWRAGISPHAPYTVHPDLWAGAARLSGLTKTPLAVHLAESPEELELLRSAKGPFRRLLEDRGVWNPEAIARSARPLDYLRPLESAHRVLVIHGNYLDRDEIDWLAAHRAMASVVYCPRTHAFFGHADYPLEQMLAAGVNVALGTDSRASNPDLNLLEEMKFVANRFPAIPPHTVLEMGTLRAARALGVDNQVGSLRPGKLADLAVLQLPEADANDPYELLLSATSHVVATYSRGCRVEVG